MTAPATTTFVKEAQTSLLTISVTDEDADSYEVKIEDALQIVAIDSYAAGVGSDVEIALIGDNTIRITSNDNWIPSTVDITVAITPEYGHAGIRNFNVIATDAIGNSSTTTAAYIVEHVNRSPVDIEQDDIIMALHSTTNAIEFATYFGDPDGDKLTYTNNVAEAGIIEMLATTDSYFF